MKRKWSNTELSEQWALTAAEAAISIQGAPENQLGFFVLLKFFQHENRFPESRRDIPAEVLQTISEQVRINAQVFEKYDFRERTYRRQKTKILAFTGFRTEKSTDGRELVKWLRSDVLTETVDRIRVSLKAAEWFLDKKIECPSARQLDRYVGTAIAAHEEELYGRIHSRLTTPVRKALDALLKVEAAVDTNPASGEDVTRTGDVTTPMSFNELKADPGRVSIDSLLREIDKLNCINSLSLPAEVFADVSPKQIDVLRRRASSDTPSRLQALVDPVRHTLIAAFCWRRRREIIDSLVELLILMIHKIGVRAERKVSEELLNDFRKVGGKTQLLFRVAEAAVNEPKGVVEKVIYPVVGEKKLRDLVKEYKSAGPQFRQVVHEVMRASYSNHYRQMLPSILDNLVFRSNNERHQPVLDGLNLLRQFRESRVQFFPSGVVVPLDGVVPSKWYDLVVDETEDGEVRVNRINYEIALLQSLRDGMKCKEIWVEGADRFRNPDEDLPSDFGEKREAYYEALDVPTDAKEFIAKVKAEMSSCLATLNEGMPKNKDVKILARGKHPLSVSPLEPQEEPVALKALKAEINRLWPTTGLLDVFKEAELRVGFTDEFQTSASREALDRDQIQRRLLLCLYGLGTNTGIKRVLTGDEDETYTELLYIRKRYLTRDAVRRAIVRIVNATFAARNTDIWGEGTTACASDSKKFGAWDQNLMTEWHIRYGGRGVMIYWHVERKSMCIYSQLKRCSSSEVASMIEGVLRHATQMDVEKNYVDSHGQNAVAFAFTRLLGYELLPRLKAINRQKLYLPNAGSAKLYPNIQPILYKIINWDLIEAQYDEMIKFATALRLGTADSEAILRRFTNENRGHPTYAALQELGNAIKTIFLCRYLNSMELRREIHEGLNVVENWNSANSFIFYGKSGEVAANRLDDQEVSVLCLHLLQACMVYVNTLMIQTVLSNPAWLKRMKPADLRALTPLLYAHINPYGRFDLDMEYRLPIDIAVKAPAYGRRRRRRKKMQKRTA